MTKIIDGRKAEITEKGRRFSTYRDFAERHGYPEAAASSDSKDSRKKLENGDIVTLLTSGPHLTGYPGATLWVVEAANGERHIINEVGLRIMPADIHGVTLLPDESLGGLMREYRKVKRKACVGELVKIVDNNCGHRFPDGEIVRIRSVNTAEYLDKRDWWAVKEMDYAVLEPTDIIVIKTDEPRGKRERFRLVDRKAALGERVIIVNDRSGSGGSDGEFFRVGTVGVYCGDNDVDFNGCGNDYVYLIGKWSVNPNARRVLEPVATAEHAPLLSAQPAESQAAANIASLALRLTQAEAKITALESAIAERKVASGPVEAAPPTFSKSPSTADAYADLAAKMFAAPPVKSAQQIRDEIVERAKADVLALTKTPQIMRVNTLSGGVMSFYPRGCDYSACDEVNFVVNAEKRTVVALIRWIGGEVWAKGTAKCAPGETFNAHIGRAIALHRALGLTVPAEYLSVPQPPEVRVGDIIFYPSNSGDGRKAIVGADGDRTLDIHTHTYRSTAVRHGAQIIDDSREDIASSLCKEVA
ncbi:hypothetical protein NST07_25815 [Paenibacillus sp. FSL L8-0340]|uniref:hypothetical protein n=1 Tax=Paenibacillus sp. FSL L8-0340 TaxID=2954685 RepID=UPI0031589D05